MEFEPADYIEPYCDFLTKGQIIDITQQQHIENVAWKLKLNAN